MKKKDQEIKQKIGRQVKKFLKEYVDGAFDEKGRFSSTEIAKKLEKYYPGEKFEKNYVKSQLKSPSFTFIYWLEETHHLNLDWLFHGEENKDIKPIKL